MPTTSPPDQLAALFPQEHFQRLAEQRQRLTLMSSDERLRHFLTQHCGRRGARNADVNDARPTYQWLSKVCGMSASSISRIATGEIQSSNHRALAILHALAGICPFQPMDRWYEETKARCNDARECLRNGTDGDVLAFILAGIADRRERSEQTE